MNVPALLIVTALSCALNAGMLPESKPPSSVAVCAIESRLCQLTAWPTCMVSGLGAYELLPRLPLMLIVKSIPGPGALVEVEGLVGLELPQAIESASATATEQIARQRGMAC